MADDRDVPGPAQRYLIIFGIQVRKPSELEPIEMAFLALGIVSCLTAIGMTIERIVKSDPTSNDFVFAILLLLNVCFIMYYVLHGVFMERPFEILVSLVTVCIVLGYCIVDYVTNVDNRSTLKLVRLIIVCLLGPIDIGLAGAVAWKFFDGPGNLIVRLVGANMNFQRMCKIYYFFTAFMGFGLQMVIILLVLLLLSEERSKLVLSEKLIIGIGVPLSCFAILLGRLGARLENRYMMYSFITFCVAESAYIVFLFDRFGDNLDKTKDDKKRILFGSIIAAAVVGLLVQFGLIALTILVMRNFGKGLRERLYPGGGVSNQDASYSSHTDQI